MLIDGKFDVKIELDFSNFDKKIIGLNIIIPKNLVNSKDLGIIDQIKANCYKYVLDDIPYTLDKLMELNYEKRKTIFSSTRTK